MKANTANMHIKTVGGFGEEWQRFNQSEMNDKELLTVFSQYFTIFPFELLNENSIGIDIGCGSGRWAKCIAPMVKKLYCVDASDQALQVAKNNLSTHSNVDYIHASLDAIPVADDSLDFAYSLGVLHHIPDTAAGIQSCVKKLKRGAPFLVYLYYRFDNKPLWFRRLWQISDLLRKGISELPFTLKLFITNLLATTLYFPLARIAKLAEKCKINVEHFPLSAYRHHSFYTMRTDALDRFGTRLEQRFTRAEIITMLENAGLTHIKISDEIPYWCAIGFKE